MTFNDYIIFFLFSTVLFYRIRTYISDQKTFFAFTWILRISLCMLVSCLLKVFGITQAPTLINFIIILLGLFCFESFRTWRIISVFYRLEAPIFPRFNFKSDTLVWPQVGSFDKLRSFLKKNELNLKIALSTAIERHKLSLISSVFYNKEGTIRVQILFPSESIDKIMCNVIAISIKKNGDKLITSNISMPFGYFSAKNIYTKNYILKSPIDTIFTHLKRIAQSKDTFVKLDDENVIEIINEEFRDNEQYGLAIGLCQKATNSDVVCLSQEGAYKLWASILQSSFIGI